MNRFLIVCLLSLSALADELPPAPQILAAARAQLPPYPVEMSGELKQWAANNFMKQALDVEMLLDWSAMPPQADYKIRNPKSGATQSLTIFWKESGVAFDFAENGEPKELDLSEPILGSGVSWIDLTFSFLWNQQAQTIGTGRKLGKECFVVAIPRPGGHELRLWVEKETGRLLGAEEHGADGERVKIIKVVSVKKFDDLWMVKDLDIIQPAQGGRTSLRINRVEAQP